MMAGLWICPCVPPCSLSPGLPLQQESPGLCFSQPRCVCGEGGRSLSGSGAAPRRSQLCQTLPGSSLPGHPHPLRSQAAEAVLCHALCQTDTYGEGTGAVTLWKSQTVGVCMFGILRSPPARPQSMQIHTGMQFLFYLLP